MRIIEKDTQERMTKCKCCKTTIAYKMENVRRDAWSCKKYIVCPVCKEWVSVSTFDTKIGTGDLDVKTLKEQNQDLQKSVDQIYEDYQDIGRMYFDLKEKTDTAIATCKKYLHEETEAFARIILNILEEKKERLKI